MALTWAEQVIAKQTEIKAAHLIELRNAASGIETRTTALEGRTTNLETITTDHEQRIQAHVQHGGVENHPDATTVLSGFMSAADKTYLEGIPAALTTINTSITNLQNLTGIKAISYKSPGSYSLKIPPNTYVVYISMCGGAGGGGGGDGSCYHYIYSKGGNGGNGASVYRAAVQVSPNSTYTITVGAGGNGGSGDIATTSHDGIRGGTGGSGGSSSFGNLLTCTGGTGGGGGWNSGGYNGPNGANGSVLGSANVLWYAKDVANYVVSSVSGSTMTALNPGKGGAGGYTPGDYSNGTAGVAGTAGYCVVEY